MRSPGAGTRLVVPAGASASTRTAGERQPLQKDCASSSALRVAADCSRSACERMAGVDGGQCELPRSFSVTRLAGGEGTLMGNFPGARGARWKRAMCQARWLFLPRPPRTERSRRRQEEASGTDGAGADVGGLQVLLASACRAAVSSSPSCARSSHAASRASGRGRRQRRPPVLLSHSVGLERAPSTLIPCGSEAPDTREARNDARCASRRRGTGSLSPRAHQPISTSQRRPRCGQGARVTRDAMIIEPGRGVML